MMEFHYSPGWLWLAGAGLLAAMLLLASYALAVGRPAWGLRVALLSLRWVAIAAVAICLLDPQRVTEIRRQQAGPVAVLLDSSRSMNVPDAPEGRLGGARTWLRQDLFPQWPSSVPRELRTFSQSLETLSHPDAASPTGRVTALSAALEHLLAVPREEPLAGVILCTDGIDTEQGDPLAVARAFRRKGIPIHTATFGTGEPPRDVVLHALQVKRAVPNQAPTRLSLTLRSPGFTGAIVPVVVRQGSQVMASQSVRLNGAEQRVEMDFTPRQKGFQTYEASVAPQAGEWLASNNRRVFGLEVVDPTLRVIYMEGTPMQSDAPIPEWKYLKDALESDKNIKVKVLYQPYSASSGGSFSQTVDADPQSGDRAYPVNHATRGFPRTLAELLQYDVIIHSDIKTTFFQPAQMQAMAAFVEQHGGGFVMVGGNSAFGKGGYHRTIIDRIIPVAMQQSADSAKLSFKMQIVPAALDHPLLALGASRAETLRIWTDKLPELHGYNRVDRAKPGATVLATTPTTGLFSGAYGAQVVLAVQEVGRGRTMAFTSDTTRTWGADFETVWGERLNASRPLEESNCDARYYRAFWINAVRWLAANKLGKTNNPVTLELAQGNSLPGQSTAARVKVRDAEGHDLTDADVALVLSAGGRSLETNRAGLDPAAAAYLAAVRPALPGQYTVTAVATRGGRRVGEDPQLLICEETDRELADVRARPEVMAEMARLSGGQDLTSSLRDKAMLASVFDAAPPAAVNFHRTPLWDNAWWLLGILGLLTVEWAVRRLKGLA